jgi:hypothetical protein
MNSLKAIQAGESLILLKPNSNIRIDAIRRFFKLKLGLND